jgi:hypothetical protein
MAKAGSHLWTYFEVLFIELEAFSLFKINHRSVAEVGTWAWVDVVESLLSTDHVLVSLELKTLKMFEKREW